jgi:hypothetical protein
MEADIIRDMAGRPVDCSSQVWRLNTPGGPLLLEWDKLGRLPEAIRDAARMYARSRIPLWAPPSVHGLFYMYKLLDKCPCFGGFEGVVTMRAFEELRQDRRAGSAELTRYRNWYQWAATFEHSGFDKRVARILQAITIGANPHGRAARKKDPDQGPLTDAERRELLNKTLDAADDDDGLPLDERVAMLLGMGLGANSGPLSLLQVQDYSTERSGGTSYHLLLVPRHKKGFAKERADFRPRQIEGEWATYLERLIAQNRAAADRLFAGCKPDNVAIPIFMRHRLRTDLSPAMGEYALHRTPSEFSQLLQRACDRVDARSRDGDPLNLNQRRFRSTLASNLIANGMSRRAVADALDHGSTISLKYYEFLNHRLVESLDARVGDAMKRVAGAFLGTLTEKSSEVARHRSPSSRKAFFDRERDGAQDLGNCGGTGKCDLPAPLACYTCAQFEPWIDAPHDRLLAQLEAERERRKTSKMHPRIVAVQDPTIEAVAEVVEKIKDKISEAP